MKVFKYPMSVTDIAEVEVPFGAKLLSVQAQWNKVWAWFLVDEKEERKVTKRFAIRGTGHPVEDAGKFISTVQLYDGSLVRHVFEAPDEAPDEVPKAKMESKTLVALKESIAIWEKNATAESIVHIRMGRLHCPLCQLFNAGDNPCKGCPVKERTGLKYCSNTPYDQANSVKFGYDLHDRKTVEDFAKFKAAAKEEVVFLKSLLPEGESIP